jgi:hypothetical protein
MNEILMNMYMCKFFVIRGMSQKGLSASVFKIFHDISCKKKDIRSYMFRVLGGLDTFLSLCIFFI